MNMLIENLTKISTLLQGNQKKFYNAMISSAKQVKCVPISEVFTAEEIKMIKRAVKPQPKQCYKNAFLLSLLFQDKVKYCEGQVESFGLGIDHAFNKVGEKYVDITFELVLKKKVKEYEYITIGEYEPKTAQEVMVETGYYGNVFNTLYLKEIKNN